MIGHLNLARGFRGGERQTQLLVEGLAARGYRQRLIARRAQPLAERCAGLAGLELRETGSSLLSAALACRRLALVHAHDGRSVHAAALARSLFGVPYVVTRRVAVALKRSFLTRRSYRRAACVAVLSRAIEQQVHNLDANIACAVVPDACSQLPVDAAAVSALKTRYAGRFVVGHVGALDDATKGQRDLLAVARAVHTSHPDLLFVLVGDGPDAAAFHAEASDLANVEFAGQVSNVGDYLAAFDAFAFPSRHEGMGSTLLDAMHAGLPIVATAVGGIVDLIRDGENGMLVAASAPEQLSAALLALRSDPKRAAALVESGRRVLAHYSVEAMVARYLEIYGPMLPTHFSAEST